ncbi:MAG TPA: PAS domain S-box protein [Candidatus Omnitrophota bacterium]|nr:PAS domain S-box protein [Candidatus Omnitrophota bacterium]
MKGDTGDLFRNNKKTRDGMIASEERFRTFFDNMPSCVAVYKAIDNGDDFVFCDLNSSLEKAEQVSKKDVVGRKVTEVFPYVEKFGLLEVLRRVWKSGQAEYFPPAYYSDERVRGWKENSVYRLPSGEIVAIYEDVTARKEMELALKESQDFLNGIIENIPDMVFVKSAKDLRFLRFNKASERILGYSSEEMTGKNCHDLFPDKEADLLEQNDRKALSSGRMVYIPEETVIDKKGAKRTIRSKVIPIMGADMRPLYLLGICEDITERKKMEEDLLRKE